MRILLQRLATHVAALRPFILFLYKKKFARIRHHSFFGVYDSQKLALKDTKEFISNKSNDTAGYNTAGTESMYDFLLNKVTAYDYPALFWLDQLIQKDDRIFDIGGHIGLAYYNYRRLLNLDERIQLWTVCDVEQVTAGGLARAQKERAIQLKFTNTLSEMKEHQLIICQGALQYLEDDSIWKSIESATTKPRAIIFNTAAVHDTEDYWTINNIGLSYVPYHISSRAMIVLRAEALGYRLTASWKNPGKSCTIPLREDLSLSDYSGFLFERLDV